MTFSLVARCPKSGQLAVVVTSSSPSVAARCAYAQAGIGAVTTQNVTDPRLGPKLLAALATGLTASAALDMVVKEAHFADYRQLTVIDMQGQTACFSGAKTLGIHAAETGKNAVSAGNMLASTNVVKAVIEHFTNADPTEELGSRVVGAMQAGLAAGGEAGPLKSAGLLLVDKEAWPLADLRVDWHDAPLAELAHLWKLWQPQMHDYVTRALNPESAPSYGVPGDE